MIENYRYKEFGELKKPKSVLPWRFFSFSVTFFLVAILAYYFFSAYYLKSLSNKLNNLHQETKNLTLQINSQDKQQMIIFWSQIKNIEKLLAKHYYPSKLLNVLENNILPAVSLKNISFRADKNELTIKGLAKDYQTLAQQVYALEGLKGFKKVFIKTITTQGVNKTTIQNQNSQNQQLLKEFQIDIYFSPDLIKSL